MDLDQETGNGGPPARNDGRSYLLLSVSILSAAAISFEILLVRLFSIIQWHHFAYMIISLALLGYGVSGTFLALFGDRLRLRLPVVYLSNASVAGLSMVAGYGAAQRLPFNSLELLWNPRQLIYLFLIYLLLFVPFFCTANCIGLLFMEYRERIHRVYRSDLLGGGIGALIIVLGLYAFSPETCLKLVGSLALLSAALAGLDNTWGLPRRPAVLLLIAAIASPLVWPEAWIQLKMTEYKGLRQVLEVMDATVIEERSSPLGLLTVVESPTIPFRQAPGLSLRSTIEPPEQLGLFTDGDGLSVITRFDGRREPLAYLDQSTAALPYHLLDRPRVLILGAGGGTDLLLAYYHSADAIDAVELNPQVVDLVRDKYAGFAGGLYNLKNVRIEIDEARGFVAGTDKQYDLIQLSLLDSFAASSAGVHALSESYIYTVEAFESYLRHLEPGGYLAVTRWLKIPPRDSLKLFGTAARALERTGIPDPGQRLALIRSWNTATLIVKNGDLDEADLAAIRNFSSLHGFDTAYYPGMRIDEANRFNILEEPYLFKGASALLGEGKDGYLDRYKFYIHPATDDRPYFSHFFKWRILPELLSLRGRGGLPLIEWGYLILFATLVQAVVLSFALILFPLKFMPSGQGRVRYKIRVGGYFLALGFAFLFVEIAFIQKFILFLSHPIYAISVVLFGFLIFAGLGSGYSKRWAQRCRGRGYYPIGVAVGGIVAVSLVYLVFLPFLFESLIALPDPARVLISVILIAPLAFCMGMPFPLGMGQLAAGSPGLIPWAWGINGCASVLSAILATILAIQFGFTIVVGMALILYLFAAVLFYRPEGNRL